MRFGEPGKEEPVKPKDIYVLTATNPDALRMVAALREAGVPSALYKQDGLFQTTEARAVRDLLAAIDDPDDLPRRARAWITPFFSVPLEVLPELEELPSSDPLLERLTTWKDLADARRFESLFSRILDDSGIVLRELLFKGDERALTNYFHLFELLLEEARGTGCGLADLVAHARRLHQRDAPARRRGRQRPAPGDRPCGRAGHDHPQEQGARGRRCLRVRRFHARLRRPVTCTTTATSACSTSTRRRSGKRTPRGSAPRKSNGCTTWR